VEQWYHRGVYWQLGEDQGLNNGLGLLLLGRGSIVGV
jgi:hypothetical protein